MSKFKLNRHVAWIDPVGMNSKIMRINDIENEEDYTIVDEDGTSLTVTEEEIEDPEDTYVCPQCGCIDIEVQAWIKYNSDKYAGEIENRNLYCPDCEDAISDTMTAYDFYKKQFKMRK